MKNISLVKDIENLTQIPSNILEKISALAEKDICNIVYEEYVTSDRTLMSIDIGIGYIILDLESEDGYIQYTFEPSSKLEKMLIKTINEKESPLVDDIEKSLTRRVVSLYKELV